MSHEIYIFGSITRGEVTPTSDTDILVVPLANQEKRAYPLSWSYYTEETLKSMHGDGRLFSWHLYLDSRCIYTPRDIPLLVEFGEPSQYKTAVEDIEDLKALLEQSMDCLRNQTPNLIYEIGIVHTCLRDIAMSASWYLSERPCFSIYAPYSIEVQLPLDKEIYKATVAARHNSTRGANNYSNWDEVASEVLAAPISGWAVEVQERVSEFVS